MLRGLRLGYQVGVLGEAGRAVDVTRGSGDRALAHMQEQGAQLALCAEIAE